MKSILYRLFGAHFSFLPWSDKTPIRAERFSVERLEQHAITLASAQPVTTQPPKVLALHARLASNTTSLRTAYQVCATDAAHELPVVPAAQWLLDNYHLIENQIREIHKDLPLGYYRQLPKLADGPFAGYPRILGIAWAFVAHTDSHLDPQALRQFIAAYQQVQPLTIGELWAVAITLRIILIENLRRLTDQIMADRAIRADADALADALLAAENARAVLDADIATRSPAPLPELFAAQLAKRLRGCDPRTMPALEWLERRLEKQNVAVEDAVQHVQERLGASNVSVRNVITSMRLISDLDWAELFEDVSLVDERLRNGSNFATMDFATRNLYRSAIEQLARGSGYTELDVAKQTLLAAQEAMTANPDAAQALRVADPGYHLIAEGRPAFEHRIGFRPSLLGYCHRFSAFLNINGYIGSILLTAIIGLVFMLDVLLLPGSGLGWLALFTLFMFLPATEAATALANRTFALRLGATPLPGLELAQGVPTALRTLVVVPTLLTSEAGLLKQVEQLEAHYLAGIGGDLSFALLLDGADADQEVLDSDAALLATATEAIARLNRRYGPQPFPGSTGERFLLLYRRRIFNESEGKWIGWERKRGKLHELNRLLRGATDTTFVAVEGRPPSVPADVRYVITLDADTRLPRETVLRLIGKMAHPLNRPRFSEALQRIVTGYAILQPRVTFALPLGRGSLYQRVFSGAAGIDLYASAVSDIYQDLFGEGSYTGKGIYDVDAFEAALAGRIRENALLSHDLFEGIFARAGLASDIELVEDAPSRYDLAAKRQYRWTRGDWQLLPWLLGRPEPKQAIPGVGYWKILDNLRRSLLAPSTLLALATCWMLPLTSAVKGTLFVVATLALPMLLPVLFSLIPHGWSTHWRYHFRRLLAQAWLAVLRILLSIAFLADQAWRMGDAIVRTWNRLYTTRRHLLEWTTAEQLARESPPDIPGFYRQMAGGTLLGLGVTAGATLITPSSWPLAWFFAVLWMTAPVLAWWASRTPENISRQALPAQQALALRLIARRTWRYFETFVTPAEHMLPPDNFQEAPKPAVAHRTSPTNIGLYLLAAVAARDFGWTGTLETIERLEAALTSMRALARFKGHFFNWYGTQDLQPLAPAYVSSVDSGNLAGHLLALANACEEWIANGLALNARDGMDDHLLLASQSLDEESLAANEQGRQIAALFEESRRQLNSPQTIQALSPALKRLASKAAKAARALYPVSKDKSTPELVFWSEVLMKSAIEHGRDHYEMRIAPLALQARLQAIADTAREMVHAMDFAFLLDPQRKLLSIGYAVSDGRLDPACYDLLASEARLASLVAIAKGDVTTRHWLRLGRISAPLGSSSVLLSWSGSMFEYLMPSLVLRAPTDSLIEQTTRGAVHRQQKYGRSRGVPWGISESAFNARDLEFTYQYSNFGVPGLGLKRGLSEDLVIAPYATALAAMVDPVGAIRNYTRLIDMGALSRYGFFEALDFTASRVPLGKHFAFVQSFMAHHQGMSIVAIANVLQDGSMRRRFHREPMIRASELLLQERLPTEIAAVSTFIETAKTVTLREHVEDAMARRYQVTRNSVPITHLLSNGRYTVMLSATGGGYSRWKNIAVTRWRQDTTRDDWGTFIFLRDVRSDAVWCASSQPLTDSAKVGPITREVVFSEDHAEFVCHHGTLTTAMEVVVSEEDDCEVRQISLTNDSTHAVTIELTSYAEVVLAPSSTDNAHQVFSKLFVETDYAPEFGALTATRRRRSPQEAEVWSAHFAVVEAETVADPQYESDRARFIGRGRHIGQALALTQHRPLSNTAGAVLDPIFSLRRRIRIMPGQHARVSFWTVVASSREAMLDLVDKHHDRSAFERARTLAWTQAQVQLRHLGIGGNEAADFQRLTMPILYAHSRFRAPSESIRRGAGAQSKLWPYSISGDLPIVLLHIDDVVDLPQVRQLLQAHEYWRMKQLAVDLVIINEHAPSYLQELQEAIDTAVRSSQSRPRIGDTAALGSVHVLRADLLGLEVRELLQSIAHVVLFARRGLLTDQLVRLASPARSVSLIRKPNPPARPPHHWSSPAVAPVDLEFFNGLGGFDQDGREYVVMLNNGRTTPAPWINVIANPSFGFQVSAEGSGYTWSENSRENQLTPWSNDPVVDPAGEALYVRDEATGELWTATAQPIRSNGLYRARHGHGYSRFDHQTGDLELELLQYVPLTDPIKVSRLTLRNLSDRPRQLSVTAYAEWVMGTSRAATAPFIMTEIDKQTGAMLARNPWSNTFAERVAFADLGGLQSAWTADRTEFLGRNGTLAAPAALARGVTLSGTTGAGYDPCSALQRMVELEAGETLEVVWFIGQCASLEQAQTLLAGYREADLDAVLQTVTTHWETLLGTIQVKTPDRAMDIMLNGWLLYQTLACRIWARSAFYQASGAYGFRDQLQDGMAMVLARPAETRAHLLRAAGRQFVEGDVQHWWLPQSGMGVRTHISDDRVWLAFATAHYVACTGDTAILDETVPFIDGPQLRPDEHDAFFQPMIATESASLFEHCARGLEHCLERNGVHGLPLIGTGDWNDGMSRVGEGGQGESVWLGWLLVRSIDLFAPIAEARGDSVEKDTNTRRAQNWRTQGTAIREAIEQHAWDGAWYRRATFDDGTWLGSSENEECRIDSIAQSWAVLSGAADPQRAATAMASVSRYLILEQEKLALLFTPPFDKTPHDPGYIKGYPPGLRENGGQYSHAAMWAMLAFTKLGAGREAGRLFALLNPINHATTAEQTERYKVEPYVVAADIYSVAPHVGRGGWTWYTGAAGWMYRAGTEGILGLRREGDNLIIDPCLPEDWPGCEMVVNLDTTHYEIQITVSSGSTPGIPHASLDGEDLAITERHIRVPLDDRRHRLLIYL
ncbi:GH36-type glycosyl hydrolase domain-containing protein [Azomonas macrocytogenes]|uniref:Cyclic beta-1,2-glucan synthetase n=1 Tax=Azomonas macrocytogenes TaxID=69962 RepID=A0A839T230_AZOMA|nr:glucoamylase family protein [Azomonas macrocytogenes]MBB3102566.1 cyclic beta-1,2-glucan synthetase [Azomonas macrocytogenes]